MRCDWKQCNGSTHSYSVCLRHATDNGWVTWKVGCRHILMNINKPFKNRSVPAKRSEWSTVLDQKIDFTIGCYVHLSMVDGHNVVWHSTLHWWWGPTGTSNFKFQTNSESCVEICDPVCTDAYGPSSSHSVFSPVFIALNDTSPTDPPPRLSALPARPWSSQARPGHRRGI